MTSPQVSGGSTRSGYLYSATSVCAMTAAGIATGTLSARALGATGRGDLAALLYVPALVSQFANVAISQAVAHLDAGHPVDRADMARVAVIGAFTAGLAVSLVLAPCLPLLVPSLQPQLMPVAALCLLYVPLVFVFRALLGASLAAGAFRAYYLTQMLAGAVQVSLMALLWALGRATAASFAGAVVLTMAIVLLINARGLSSLVSAGAVTTTAARTVAMQTWRFMQPELAGIALLRVDVPLLARMVPSQQLGLYVGALTIAAGQAMVAPALGPIAFQATMSASGSKARGETLAAHLRLSQWAFLAIAAIAVAGAPVAVRIAFGSQFVGSVATARFLVVAFTVWSCSQVLESGLRGMDLARPCTLANLLGLVALLVLSSQLVPRFGIAGMGWSMLAAQSLAFMAKLLAARRATGIGIWAFFAVSRRGFEDLYSAGVRDGWRPFRRPRPELQS